MVNILKKVLNRYQLRVIRKTRSQTEALDVNGQRFDGTFPLRNKGMLNSILRDSNIPCCNDVAWLSNESALILETQKKVTLEHFLQDLEGRRLFFKPNYGSGGDRAFLVEFLEDDVKVDGFRSSYSDLRNRLPSIHEYINSNFFIAQSVIEQHDAVDNINDSSVNTLRILTLYSGDEVLPFRAVWRIGVSGSIIDNWSSGGLLIGVDIETGATKGKAWQKKPRKSFTHHPDSGERISGFEIPFFDDAFDIVKRAHRRLPFVRTLGWDVAITPDGPMIVEVNDKWSVALFSVVDEAFQRGFVKAVKERKLLAG